MEYIVIDIFSALIEYWVLYAFLWIFFEKNPARKKWFWFSHIIFPILFFIFSNFIEDIHIRPILFIVSSWLIALGFKNNFLQRIFSISIFQIILIFVELIIFYLIASTETFSYENTHFTVDIPEKIVSLAILFLLFLFSKNKSIVLFRSNPKHIFILSAFSITSFFLIMLTDYLMLKLNNPKLFILECIAILFTIVTNIGLYYLFYQLSAGEEAKDRLKFINFYLSQQKENQTYMEQSYQEIRRISHDMKHYLTALLTLVEENEIERVKRELQSKQIEITNNQPFDTGYSVLNSVLLNKMQIAQNNQIQTQLFWNLNEPILINLTDVAIILANGLDNAIEATRQVHTTQPFIQITAKTVGEYLRFIICNNTASAPIVIDGEMVTTKKDKQLHGIGLNSIKTLAHRYEGESFTTYVNYIFTLTVVLKNTPIYLNE